MSLAGLLTIVDDDPQLHQVVARAEYDTNDAPGPAPDATAPDAATLAGEDLIAPPALRPVLAAALASAGRFVLAVTATAREADDLTAALGSFLPEDRVACLSGRGAPAHERPVPPV